VYSGSSQAVEGQAVATSDATNGFAAEFLDDFFVECDEHLTTVRSDLLTLEAFVGRPHIEPPLLDSLFRAFHSLKGLAGMVGLAAVEQLAHQMESYLRALRQGQLVLSSAAIDALAVGTRTLEQVIAARRVGATAPDPAPALELLAAAVPKNEERPSEQPLVGAVSAPALPPEVQQRIVAAVAAGISCWRVTFTPTPTLSERGINVNTVRERLQRSGEIAHAAPLVAPQGISFLFVLLGALTAPEQAAWQSDGIVAAPLVPPTALSLSSFNGGGRKRTQAPLTVAPSHIVRVDIARLDTLLHMLGELVMTQARLDDQFARIEGALPTQTWRTLQDLNQGFARQLRDLRAGMMRVRMVPISDMFARMQFVVRDLAHDSGKEALLELRGQETEIDKLLVERMRDPLLHLVRNAVSHGLELPGERRALGKPAAGTLALHAAVSGDTVQLTVADDGRGIDRSLVAARAQALGLRAPGDSLDDEHLLALLCTPGFSTREQADHVSGRGMGMDVVRQTIYELGGTLALTSEEGRGTAFTIQLPLTLAIVDALIVEAAGQTYAVPLPLVREVMRIMPEQITAFGSSEVVRYREGVLPLVRLAERFGLPSQPDDTLYAFVVASGTRTVGFVVDHIRGKREIVVRPMHDPLLQTPGVAGATELGDGRIVLILNPVVLM